MFILKFFVWRSKRSPLVSLSFIASIVGWLVCANFKCTASHKRCKCTTTNAVSHPKTRENPHEKKRRKKNSLHSVMVQWTLGCFRTLRMRVRVRYLHECTERMLLPLLDVDSTVHQRIAHQKQGRNTIVMNEGFGELSHCLHRAESWIFYQTVPRPPWFPKSKVYGAEIFTILLHICELRRRTTSEKLFSIEVLLIPPCITAIETSHKQKEDV